MGAILGVRVPSLAGHGERSETQLRKGDRAWGGSVKRSREPMNKNRIQGDPGQGEQAYDCEAFVTKERGRRFGGCAGKDRTLTRGSLASCLKGRRSNPEREVSRGRSSCPQGAKGQTRRRVDRLWDSKVGTGT
jgi:hypothetical protein